MLYTFYKPAAQCPSERKPERVVEKRREAVQRLVIRIALHIPHIFCVVAWFVPTSLSVAIYATSCISTYSISGLVVEYIVAIDVTRVRFPADAFLSGSIVGLRCVEFEVCINMACWRCHRQSKMVSLVASELVGNTQTAIGS